MKTNKWIFLTLFLMFNLSYIYSQEYIRFPEEGAAWSVKYSGCGEMPCQVGYLEYLYTGDTVINEKKYSILRDGNSYNFVYDTNKIVYVYEPIIDDTIMLYNFNLNINDTFTLYHNPGYDTIDFIVYDKDSIKVGANYFMRIELDAQLPPSEVFDTLVWIESIGSVYGPIYYNALPMHEEGFVLTCYQKNDSNLYGECTSVGIKNDSFEPPLVKPNPVEDYSILDIGFNEKCILKIYNTTGQLITKQEIIGDYVIKAADYKKGIYFYTLTNRDLQKTSGKFVVP